MAICACQTAVNCEIKSENVQLICVIDKWSRDPKNIEFNIMEY